MVESWFIIFTYTVKVTRKCMLYDQTNTLCSLRFDNVSSLLQQSTSCHVAPLGHIILIPCQQQDELWANVHLWYPAYMFNVYKNQLSRQTGSRNLTGPKTHPTIWHTYMKLVTIYQISTINSYWEKCDEKYLETDRVKTVYPRPLSGGGGDIIR